MLQPENNLNIAQFIIYLICDMKLLIHKLQSIKGTSDNMAESVGQTAG